MSSTSNYFVKALGQQMFSVVFVCIVFRVLNKEKCLRSKEMTI